MDKPAATLTKRLRPSVVSLNGCPPRCPLKLLTDGLEGTLLPIAALIAIPSPNRIAFKNEVGENLPQSVHSLAIVAPLISIPLNPIPLLVNHPLLLQRPCHDPPLIPQSDSAHASTPDKMRPKPQKPISRQHASHQTPSRPTCIPSILSRCTNE